MKKGLSFKEAERIAVERRRLNSPENFRRVTIQQGKGSVKPKDLPFVSDCYRRGSEETKAAIDNLDNVLSVEDAKRLSKLFLHLHFDEFESLLKKEMPKLHSACNGRLTYAALHAFIDFRAGNKMVFEERVEK